MGRAACADFDWIVSLPRLIGSGSVLPSGPMHGKWPWDDALASAPPLAMLVRHQMR
jgi:hypothetical protein